MKQQVNLYTAVLQPIPEIFPLPQLIGCWIAALVLLFAALGWAQWQSSNTQTQLEKLRSDVELARTQMTEMTLEVQRRKPPQLLLNTRERLQAELALKQRLLTSLQTSAPLKQPSFSALMAELASRPAQDVWLSRIHASGVMLSLSGSSYRSESVPKWVQSFSGTAHLGQIDFSSLAMELSEQGVLNFTLSSQQQ